MFPFWEKVVAPVLEAADAHRLVEIGALRGEQTQLILDRLGADGELHVIDPVPDFDPDEHRRRFGPGYHFHRALSLDVLGDLPPMDAALVDGDHNWYTVRNELDLLAQVARRAGAPLPVLVLHDVAWPYGRRDLYYDPDTIPAEHRQEWRRKGMRPGVERLVPMGGLNPTMANAVVEGGPHNGVMTALDDFVADHDRALRVVVLPIYFGLAIAVEEQRLADQPALARFLDELEAPAGRQMLLELAESMRLEAMIFQHRIFFEKEAALETLADRYLDSVKRGLTNEHHLENEVRLAHLADCATNQRPVELPRLRDPRRHDLEALERLQRQRRTGQVSEGTPPSTGYAFAPAGRDGLDHLHERLETVRRDHIRGHLVSCSEDRGGAAILMRAHLDAHGLRDRDVWVAGRFRAAADGRRAPDLDDGLTELRPDLNLLRDGFERFGVLDDRVRFLQGDLAATLPDGGPDRIAILHIGPGTGADARTALDHLYPRVAIGGQVVVDDRSDEALAAVETYRRDHAVTEPEPRRAAGGTAWTKQVDRHAAGTTRTASAGGEGSTSRIPLARPAPSGTCDLSVVVVFYDMAREARRTLHALSRAYQEGIEDLDYEVLVVENGTPAGRGLDRELVESHGTEFRYLDLGAEAVPSPVNALNRGIGEARGDTVALMIDGAHLLTPGVLRHAMVGARAYEPAVVAVQPWYLGPGQQGDTMRSGYDQDHEDALLDGIAWPAEGYRLFDVGHFQGDRDWFDGLWESNCLFAPRKLLEQVGGFDEGFDTAGGGYANLDLYERLGAAPGVHLVSVLGEGSFHQVHGGTTTNQSDPAERRTRIVAYGEQYAELRGRPYTGPEKQIHYVGSFQAANARRTRARRLTGEAFDVEPEREGRDGPMRSPMPIPDDVRDGFVAAYWRSRAWRRSSWLGHPTLTAPTDLVTYQELVTEVRPEWIVETGTKTGGRALFLAHLCDLLGHGQVVSVDNRVEDGRPVHHRLHYVEGRAHDPETVGAVRLLTGDHPAALVILGTRGARRRMHREFEAYAPLVPVGSYLVMEHTVLNGYPVDATFGPGPFEALRRILNTDGDFVSDTRWEKHGLSFNPGGFLRRVR